MKEFVYFCCADVIYCTKSKARKYGSFIKINGMPQISFFYGIVILMNFADHAPAHFHAWYGDFKVIVSIKDGVVKGEMPGRALKMILEWLEIHREELLSNWGKAQNGMPLDKIEPLN